MRKILVAFSLIALLASAALAVVPAVNSAISAANLSDGTTGTGSIMLNTGPTLTGVSSPTYAQGKLVFDTDNDSLTFYNSDSNISLQVGQEQWLRAKNTSGSTIGNGKAVYVSGASSGLPTIAPARADVLSTSSAVGLVTEACTNNSTCFVTISGAVHGLDTSGFTAGAIVYLSAAVAGGLTSAVPAAPNIRKQIGVVGVSDASAGTITVLQSDTGQIARIFTATYDPASLAAAADRCDAVTVTGITTTGGAVVANPGVDNAAGCVIASVHASAADTVRVCWRNAFSAVTACDTASSTWTFTQAQ